MTKKNKTTKEQTPEIPAKHKKKQRRGFKITIVAVLAVMAVGGGMLLAHFDVFNGGTDEMTMEEFFAQEGNTSFDLIDKAYEEDKIDKETSLVYGAYAAFGDERLPEEYRSEVRAFEANDVFIEIHENYDGFSLENKEIIDPFLKRPDEEGSYWNQKAQEFAKSDSEIPGIAKTAEAKERAVKNIFSEHLLTADSKVKIWYAQIDFFDSVIDNILKSGNIKYFNETERKTAEEIKKTIDEDKIYAEFADIMQKEPLSDGNLGGDKKLDIYVISPLMMDYKRLTLQTSGQYTGVLGGYIPDNSSYPTSGYLILTGTTKTITAHEIFHAFQAAFPHDGNNDYWFAEATAVWSEDFIYPGENSEQKWLKTSPIKNPNYSLDNTSLSGYEYGAYIFPFYLTQPQVSTNKIIGKIWAGCDKHGSCLNSIDKNIKGGYKDHWRDFTLWNYNQEPVKLYQDKGGFSEVSSGATAYQDDIKEVGDISIETEDLKYLTAHLADVYNKTDSSEVKQIVFKDLKNFTSQSDSAAIKAVVYPKNGAPYLDEEWTGKDKRRFCLENSRENFGNIVLIFSNGEVEKGLAATEITAEAKEESCYTIDQEDQRTAKIVLPSTDSAITVKTEGSVVKSADKEVQYGYQAKWEIKTDFAELWNPYTLTMSPLVTCTITPGKTTYSATLKFDLSSVEEGSSFPIEVINPATHYDPWQSVCTMIGTVPPTDPFDYGDSMLGDGMIYDMKESGAKIKIPESLPYGNWPLGATEPWRVMEPIVLEIKGSGD